MTREEAIEYNKNLREYMKITDKKSEYKFLKENYEALDMAIQALSQEPQCTEHPCLGTLCRYYKEPCCDECKYKTFTELYFHTDPEMVEQEPKPKTGYWVHKGQGIYCSECGKESGYNSFGASRFSDYCPNCGAKMDEQEEVVVYENKNIF